MFRIDSTRCNGCWRCVEACPRRAIAIRDNLAVIDETLCVGCGACASVCPSGAISETKIVSIQSDKGGEKMMYGFGRGFGRRVGVGFGFRGAAPPWPYAGRGRGGLPRCWYPGLTTASTLPSVLPRYTFQTTPEGNVEWLKSQAETIKAELDRVEARICDLERSN